MSLVECITNFSEGRREDVIQAIRKTIADVPSVYVLDVQSDSAHNRSVITFAGSAQAVGEAAFQATKTAQQLINLDQHQGEHPRLGATDVIPFVPLGDTTMAECVALARQVGQRIGKELGIAVYLYEEAATRPERRNLADVRRGEYEGWRSAIENDSSRIPDFGPTRATPAGATTIGARQPLIAYNVYLNTNDVELARTIAKAIRHSSGGLRYVKALGMLVHGRAQISMNLVDYKGTPIHRVVEMIRAEAARYGVAIAESEIVGLVPEDALFEAVEYYLHLNHFRREQVLESRLAFANTSDTPQPWLPSSTVQAFAQPTPTPGGGSAAAMAGALAGALGQMVSQLSLKKTSSESMQHALERLQQLSNELAQLVQLDSDAYEDVLKAKRLPTATKAHQHARTDALQEAWLHATHIPLTISERSVDVLHQLKYLADHGLPQAKSDVIVGAYLAHAACMGASVNVLVNLQELSNSDHGQKLEQRVHDLRATASDALDTITH